MRDKTKAAVALLLTFSAGFVDIVGFLALFDAFTAHMTGVTVHLAHNLIDSNWSRSGVFFGVLVAFMVGSVVARTIIEIALRHDFQRAATAALSVELALLLTVASLGAKYHVGMVLLLAIAMGMQTGAVTRVGSLTIHTTFVTGMMNKLAQLLSHAFFLGYDQAQGRTERAHLRSQVHRQIGFISTVWALYFGGALAGTAMDLRWGVQSLYLPSALVLATIIIDQIRPLPIAEERDQAERS